MDDDQGDRSVGDGDLSLFVLSSLLFLLAKSHCLIVLSCVFHQHVCFPPTASIYFCLIKNSRFLLATLSSSSSSSPAAASFSFSAITQKSQRKKNKIKPDARCSFTTWGQNSEWTNYIWPVNARQRNGLTFNVWWFGYPVESCWARSCCFFLSSTVILIRAKMR